MRFQTLLTLPVVQALGWSLLQFVWQGFLLGLLLWIVKMVVPRSAMNLRYGAASLIMLIMPVALIVTAAQHLRQDQTGVNLNSVGFPNAQGTGLTQQGALGEAFRATGLGSNSSDGLPAWVAEWVVCLWAGGVLLLSARAFGGWVRMERVKRHVLLPSEELQDMVRRLKQKLSVSAPVRLYTSAMIEVPTVMGWLRPRILLPLSTLTGLSEAQLRAVLAHEMAHIRRHDYLLNLLQAGIETMLFYHPAVWWVSRQMRIERENCCDDIAVAICGNAIEYAEALAELEQIRSRIPGPALAATGGDLLRRIRRLLGQEPSEERALRYVGAFAAAVLVVFIAGASAVAKQPAPKFEAASIKLGQEGSRGDGGTGGHLKYFPGRVTGMVTTRRIILDAYHISPHQIFGGPGWLDSDRFDVEAKAATAANKDELRLMLRTLLAERFQLKVRRGTKEMPVYALILAKDRLGPNLHELKEGEPRPEAVWGSRVGPVRPPGGTVVFQRINMQSLALTLSRAPYNLGRPVVDKTGLNGVYTGYLRWMDADDTVAAVQEELGLRLEPGKAPMDTLFIEKIERPTGN